MTTAPAPNPTQTPAETPAETPAGSDADTSPESGAPTTPGGLTFLSKAIKVTGYGRVAAGVLAAGDYHGQRAHLTLPIERVTAADIKLRIGGTRLLITAPATHPAAGIIEDAAETVARACGVEFGEIVIGVREAIKPSNGSDSTEALVAAVIDGIDKASEYGLRTSARTALAADILGGHAAGLAANAPVIAADCGTILAQPDSPSRLLTVIVAPVDGGDGMPEIDGDVTFGSLITPPADGSDPRELAEWLVACSGTGQAVGHPALDAVRAAAGDVPEVLGVIGGHTPGSAVLALLAPEHLTVSQQLCCRFRGLPEGWRASMARTAIG